MINLQTGEKTYVSRLRVRCSGLDSSVVRARLTSLLQGADVLPAGHAPSAIICIRHLDHPRTRRSLSLSGGNLSVPPEWQQSVRASIEQLVRSAPHPAREAVSAVAPCVIFSDRAELLAALAGDWCEQRTLTCWWWRALFKEALDSNALVKLWQQSPEYVPGALEHLASRRSVARFATALGEDEARAILQSVMRRFALDQLEDAISFTSQVERRAEISEEQSEISQTTVFLPGTSQPAASDSSGQPDAGAAPWRRFVPESFAANLPLPQQCLLGIGLLLQRAPPFVRSRNFALRVNLWLNACVSDKHPAPAVDLGARKTKESQVTGKRQADAALNLVLAPSHVAVQEPLDGRSPSPVSGLDSIQNLTASQTSGASTAPAMVQATQVTESAPGLIRPDAAHTEREESTQDSVSEVGLTIQTPESVESVVSEIEFSPEEGEPKVDLSGVRVEVEVTEGAIKSVSGEAAPSGSWPLLEAQIETRYGGLFHLINLGLFLKLYGDFTTPSEPGIALPIWDFVALLGRRMGGAGVENDPVWPLLTQLAGRSERQLPGEDFHPPDEWRVPVEWLRKFPRSDVWKWAIKQGENPQPRLQLIHPAKFLVLDVPLETGADVERVQLARELAIYAPVFSGTLKRTARPFRLRGRTPLAQWVERLHLYASARLQRALGTLDAKRAARFLCERHARVFVTTTHVDIVMRLAELPFEVRVAGLDRDPGWVPAAGRFIAFHFE